MNLDQIKATSFKPNIGDKVIILETETNFAKGQTGTLLGFREDGFIVEIETNVPVSGAVPSWERRKITIWADAIKPIWDKDNESGPAKK